MIYLDNAATTLHKPPEVAEAVKNAILTAGNASRGAHGVSLSASRMVFETRSRLAKLFGCPRADHVVFTANSTEALNIAIYGLFSSVDHVISTDLEHNSVLRPLYDLQTRGVSVDFVPADRQGNIRYEDMETLFRPETCSKSPKSVQWRTHTAPFWLSMHRRRQVRYRSTCSA